MMENIEAARIPMMIQTALIPAFSEIPGHLLPGMISIRILAPDRTFIRQETKAAMDMEAIREILIRETVTAKRSKGHPAAEPAAL